MELRRMPQPRLLVIQILISFWLALISRTSGTDLPSDLNIAIIVNEDDALSESSWEWSMYDINNRSDVLPNVTLTANIIKDDWSKRFLKEKSISVVLSLLPCQETRVLSMELTSMGIPHLAVNETPCLVSGEPPTTTVKLRTQPRYFIEAVVALFVKEFCDFVVMIHDKDYDPEVITGFVDKFSARNIKLIVHQVETIVDSATLKFKSNLLVEGKYNMSYFVLSRNHTMTVLRKAKQVDMLGINFNWVITNEAIDLYRLGQIFKDGDNVAIVDILHEKSVNVYRPRIYIPNHVKLQDGFGLLFDAFHSIGRTLERLNDSTLFATANTSQCSTNSTLQDYRARATFATLKHTVDEVSTYKIRSTHRYVTGSLMSIGSWNPLTKLKMSMRIFNDFTGFNGRLFTVTTAPYSPFTIRKPDVGPVFNYTGLCFEILNELARALNFTYKVIEPPDGNWGLLDNGTWKGMIGQVYRREVDFAVGPFTVTAQREKDVDFMTPFWEEPCTLLLRTPDGRNKIFTFVQPFKSNVWYLIFLSIPFTGICMWLFNRYSSFYDQESEKQTKDFIPPSKVRWYVPCWYTFGALLQQGGVWKPRAWAPKPMIALWWWFCIVLVGTYTGNLIAFLTVTKIELPINSLEDLVQDTSYSVGTTEGTALHELLRTSKVGVYKEIWDQMSMDLEGSLTEGAEEGVNKVLSGDYIYLDEKTYLESITTDNCSFQMANGDFYKALMAFPMPENSPFLPIFNERMLKILEAGLIGKWQQMHWPRKNKCVGLKTVTEAKAASLKDCQGAFYIMAILIFFSSCTLTCECIIKRYNSYREKHKVHKQKSPKHMRYEEKSDESIKLPPVASITYYTDDDRLKAPGALRRSVSLTQPRDGGTTQAAVALRRTPSYNPSAREVPRTPNGTCTPVLSPNWSFKDGSTVSEEPLKRTLSNGTCGSRRSVRSLSKHGNGSPNGLLNVSVTNTLSNGSCPPEAKMNNTPEMPPPDYISATSQAQDVPSLRTISNDSGVCEATQVKTISDNSCAPEVIPLTTISDESGTAEAMPLSGKNNIEDYSNNLNSFGIKVPDVVLVNDDSHITGISETLQAKKVQEGIISDEMHLQ